MDIEGGHENAYLQSVVVEILIFRHGLDNHHSAVGGCHKQVRVIRVQNTDGVTEEIGDEDEQCCCYHQGDGEDQPWRIEEDGDMDSK